MCIRDSLSAEVAIAPDPVRNSRFLGMQYQSIINEVAPQFVEPIIREGMADGTIRTEHPQDVYKRQRPNRLGPRIQAGGRRGRMSPAAPLLQAFLKVGSSFLKPSSVSWKHDEKANGKGRS